MNIEINGRRYALLYSEYGPYVKTSRGNNVTPFALQTMFDAAHACQWGELKLAQGGLSHSTPDSAATHWGFAYDIRVDGRAKQLVWDMTTELMKRAHCPFPRGFGGDPWANNRHIHTLFEPDSMHSSARKQCRDWHAGRNGLVNKQPYVGPDQTDYRFNTLALIRP